MTTTRISKFVHQVPVGHTLVLRNVWRRKSDSRQNGSLEPEGYNVLGEGYALWIPKVWHEPVGQIDMRPINRDPGAFETQTIDGQKVTINVRLTDRVMKGYGANEIGDECLPWDQQPEVKAAFSEPKPSEEENPPDAIDDPADDDPADDDPADKEESLVVGPEDSNNVLRFAIRVESEGATDRLPLLKQIITAALNSCTADYPAISYSLKDLEIVADTAYGLSDEEMEKRSKMTTRARLKELAERAPQALGWGYWRGADGELLLKDGKPVSKKGLAEFNQKELAKLAKEIKDLANVELEFYGLKIEQLTIQGIKVSGPLQAALERRASAMVEAHSASAEKSYLEELLKLLPEEGSQKIWASSLLIALNFGLDRVTDFLANMSKGGGKSSKSSKVKGDKPSE